MNKHTSYNLHNKKIFDWRKFHNGQIAILYNSMVELDRFLDNIRKYYNVHIEDVIDTKLFTPSTIMPLACTYLDGKITCGTPVYAVMPGYKLYDFSQLLFINTKEYITKSDLLSRGFKTGDVIVDLDNDIGIINKDIGIIVSFDESWWDNIDVHHMKYIIPVELIDSDHYIAAIISKVVEGVSKLEEILHLTIKVVDEEPQMLIKDIIQVEFTPGGKLYDFISHEDDINVGDIVECNTKNGARKYAKVKHIVTETITIQEYSSDYKFCRKSK